MLRFRLTAEDMVRVRVGKTFGPLIETAYALSVYRPGDRRTIFDGWRRRLDTEVGQSADLLASMFPRISYLDLVGLIGPSSSIEEGLDMFRQRPAKMLDAEIGYNIASIRRGFRAPTFAPPAWMHGLVERRSHLRETVAREFAAFHDVAVAPYWEGARARLDAEHTRLAGVMAAEGVDGVLNSLHPTIRWRMPHLEIAGPGVGVRTLPLHGRGVIVAPSLFCPPGQTINVDVNDDSTPVMLLYPAIRELKVALGIWRSAEPDTDALAALLGRTRAAMLQAIAQHAASTTELARLAGTSPATASLHASVLRNAGLITSHRDGKAVRHQLAALGADLLTAGHQPAPS